MGRTPDTFPRALARLAERSTPALIWRDGAERVELSGRVLVNWVEKAAGLLVDELDVAAGDPVTVSPRPHWRLVVLALAALRVGATVRFTATPGADAAVHAELESHLGPDVPPGTLLAVAEPALAFACGTELPGGTVDFCEQVRAFPDVYGGFEEPDLTDAALPDAGVSHGELLTAALAAAASWTEGTGYLPLPEGWDAPALLTTLGVMLRGGAVLLAADPVEVTEHVLEQEQAEPLPGS